MLLKVECSGHKNARVHLYITKNDGRDFRDYQLNSCIVTMAVGVWNNAQSNGYQY